jgi:hypothetical protein
MTSRSEHRGRASTAQAVDSRGKQATALLAKQCQKRQGRGIRIKTWYGCLMSSQRNCRRAALASAVIPDRWRR